MAKLKRIGFFVWVGFTLLMMVGIYLQNNKIEKLKNKLLLEEINEGQSQLIIEYIPKEIEKIAPLPKDKAELLNKIYGE